MNPSPNFKLKKVLLSRGLTQRNLAFDTKISESKLSGILRGYIDPTKNERRAISESLSLEVVDLFNGDSE